LRLCRRAKYEFTNNKCREIEKLEATHNPLLHKKIKEMMPKKYINTQSIKDKHGKLLHDAQDILGKWAQCVEELYDDTRSSADINAVIHERCVISELEVNTIIQKLIRNKATGSDNIPAEFLQSLGEKGIQMITRLMNLIYNTGILPDDFLRNTFIAIPKVNMA